MAAALWFSSGCFVGASMLAPALLIGFIALRGIRTGIDRPAIRRRLAQAAASR